MVVAAKTVSTVVWFLLSTTSVPAFLGEYKSQVACENALKAIYVARGFSEKDAKAGLGKYYVCVPNKEL